MIISVKNARTAKQVIIFLSYAIIAVRIKENDGAVTAEEICTVHDVFLNESRAREFAELCNELGLSPVHIYDAVQDAIG